jgi:hypothetical protein
MVDVEATPARLSQEIIATQPRLTRSMTRLQAMPSAIAADGRYGAASFLSWLAERDIEPPITVIDRRHPTKGKFTRDLFRFDLEKNHSVCPEGKLLKFTLHDALTPSAIYRAKASACRVCPRQSCGTEGKKRTVTPHDHEGLRQRMRALA